MDRERLRLLRGLAYAGDGAGLVALLDNEPLDDQPLQQVGDALVAAVQAGVDGALAAAVGDVPHLSLRPLPVNLEDLMEELEGDPVQSGGRIDLRAGEVWPQAALDYAEEVGEGEADEDSEDWLWIDSEGSREAYRDMVVFVDGLGDLDDHHFVARLADSLDGRGAFRRFRDRLDDRPDLLTRFQHLSDERRRGRARRWLAERGYTPVAPSR